MSTRAFVRITVGRWFRAAVALCVVFLAGCQFEAGLTPRGFDGAPVERLGIAIFDNDSRRPNLERSLHESISRAARRWSDGHLVRPESAQVIIRGRILEAERSQGIRNRANQVLESRETVRVEAELYDRRARRVVRRAETYVFVGTTLDVADAEVDARQRALDVAGDRLLLILLAREDTQPEPVAPVEAPELVPSGLPREAAHVGPRAEGATSTGSARATMETLGTPDDLP